MLLQCLRLAINHTRNREKSLQAQSTTTRGLFHAPSRLSQFAFIMLLCFRYRHPKFITVTQEPGREGKGTGSTLKKILRRQGREHRSLSARSWPPQSQLLYPYNEAAMPIHYTPQHTHYTPPTHSPPTNPFNVWFAHGTKKKTC